MATKTFGLSQTYDWSSTYWSTITNVQNTYVSVANPITSDGWLVLDFTTPTQTKDWSDGSGSGWTETSGAGSDTLFEGTHLRQYATTNDASTEYASTSFGAADTSFTQMMMIQIEAYVYSTRTAQGDGSDLVTRDGTRLHITDIRTDSTDTNIDVWEGAGTAVKHTTTNPIETTRYHIWGYYNNNGANADTVIYDGKEQFTNGENVNNTDAYRTTLQARKRDTGGTNPDHNIQWNKYFNSITPWQTADGVIESDATQAVFDAGLGKIWTNLAWTHDTSNSTAIVYQVRCATTSGGLSSASYETIANSGDPIVSKERYIQVKATLSDASSGRYTPILKTLTLTSGDDTRGHRVELGGMISIRPSVDDILSIGDATHRVKDAYIKNVYSENYAKQLMMMGE